MQSTPEEITRHVKTLREQAGLSMDAIAKAMGYKTASGYQRYENPEIYKGGFLARDWVERFGGAVIGKGAPAVTEQDVWVLAGPEFARGRRASLVDSFDPDAPDAPISDESMTIGSVTGARGIPEGATPQIDVTAGMGAGGFTIITDGIPGARGMTFAAESISDWWRLPTAILSAMGNLGPTDMVFIPVMGDSMAPTLIEGDVVAVDTRHRWPSPGGIYAINDNFGGVIVKRLEVMSRPGDEQVLVDVISDNPKHPVQHWSLEDLRIVGRVLRKFGHVG